MSMESIIEKFERIHGQYGTKKPTHYPRVAYYHFMLGDSRYCVIGLPRELGYRTGIDLVDRCIEQSDESLSRHNAVYVRLPWWFANSRLCDGLNDKKDFRSRYWVNQFRKSKTHRGKGVHRGHPSGGWDRWFAKHRSQILRIIECSDGMMVVHVKPEDAQGD